MPINSFLYPGAKVTPAYEVANSCRFNDGDSAYLNKSNGTATNTDKFTFSAWVKRSGITLGQTAMIFGEHSGDSTGKTEFGFRTDDTLWFYQEDSTTGNIHIQTNRKFRDPAAWMHLCLAVDTSQGVAANRVKLYVNGTQETSFSTATYPSADLNTRFNGTSLPLYIGYFGSGSAKYFDGYMAEVVMVDGSQLAPTSFGEFDEDSPQIFKPINVSGLTFGTNGFYLDFEDSSNLGNDANGGTDWTENNLAAADQATDTPTNSFCTMNPLDNYYPASTFSEGNNYIVSGSSPYSSNTATMGVSSGKWYYELKYVARGGSDDLVHVGIKSKQDTANTQELGHHSTDYGYRAYNGQVRNNDSDASHGNTFAVNDIIGVYIDLDNNKLYFAKNGTVQNSGTGVSITAAASTDFGFYFPAISWNDGSTTGTMALNFGGSPAFSISSGNADANGYGSFEYDPSSGTFDGSSKDFLAICTKNLGSDGG